MFPVIRDRAHERLDRAVKEMSKTRAEDRPSRQIYTARPTDYVPIDQR